MKLVELNCPKCGALLQVNDELTRCTCNYCGNEVLIDNEQREVKITGGYEFGYGSTYGQLQAAYDFNKQHICEQKQIVEQQQKEYVRGVRLNSLKRSWHYASITGVVGFFGLLILTSKFVVSILGGFIILLLAFGISFKVLVRLYLGKTTED